MVQSKGTRFDWQRFRMDLTGRKKYSGRSSALRREGAAGEIEARRAMPTSGAGAPTATETAAKPASAPPRSGVPQAAGAGGGQSAPQSLLLLSGRTSGASSS